MEAEERFLVAMTDGIITSGGTSRFDEAKARKLAEKVLGRLREIGPFAYPSLLDQDDLRFVYQWDLQPPVMTIMLWDDYMWRDMARIAVPNEINDEINQ